MGITEDALTEYQTALNQLTPKIAGNKDLLSVDDLRADTKQQVQETINIRTRRKELLDAAIAALKALKQDGHPQVPVREVPAEIKQDIDNNVASITLASADYVAPPPAAAATITGLDTGVPRAE